MAASTTSISDILWLIAQEAKEWRSDYVTEAVSSTVVKAGGLTETTDDAYNYAMARIAGKGTRTVSDYTGSTRQITVSSAFSPAPAAGDILELAYWKGDKRAQGFAAAQHLIRVSYPYWWREVLIDRNNTVDSTGGAVAAITLDADDPEYDLPSDLTALLQIGIQTETALPVRWFDAGKTWRVHGQPGAFKLRFTGLTNFLSTYDGEVLCYRYAAREPIPEDESDTTQLPLEFFAAAVEIMRRRQLNVASQLDLARFNVLLPQLQQIAKEALVMIGYIKEPPRSTLKYGLGV